MRTEEFNGGAEEVRQPQFKTVQSMSNANFRPMSVLDVPASLPNQNGLGVADHQRRMMGFKDTVAGIAQSTYDQRMWLGDTGNRQAYPSQNEK